MVTIVNDRDVLMQATSPRFTASGASLSTAVVYIYQRSSSASAPALPSAATTYSFATGALSGLNNGWSATIPAGAQQYLYVSMVSVSASTSTVSIPAASWNAAALLSSNGSNGSNGTNGTNGTNGSNGGNGARGSVTTAYLSYPLSSWNDSYAYQALNNLGYYSYVNGDIVTLANSSYSETRFYSYGNWLALTAYINGNMLVSGTLQAGAIAGGTLSGVSININSSTFVVSSSGLVSLNGLLTGSAGGTFSQGSTYPALTGTSNNNNHGIWAINHSTGYALMANADGSSSGLEAIYGYNTRGGSSSHGIRGQAKTGVGTLMSGVVGATNGYDFYADGAGTNYGPFTGAHDVLWNLDEVVDLGDIVVDAECIVRGGWSNTLFRVVRSSTPNQRGAVGVLAFHSGLLADHLPAAFIETRQVSVSNIGPSPNSEVVEVINPLYDQIKSLYERGAANALGEGQMNVCSEGGDIVAGDLIVTSSIPGKGMRQADDLVRSYTVARAREACSFSTPGEVKAIACIYLCG